MKPQLTLQTPLELPPEEISKYLKQLWISENEYNFGANTFSLIVWQPAWLEQSLVKNELINGPITGTLSPEIIETAKKLILENRLPLSSSLYSNELIDLLNKNNQDCDAEDLRGQFFESSISTLNPRRLITLAPTNDKGTKLKTFVSAYCPLSDYSKNQPICGDLVVIRGKSELIAEKGPEIIENLSINDLPTWLWWNSSLDDSPNVFDNFSRNGRRLIIDTANGNEERCINVLRKIINSKKAVNDLNWIRLKSWRESLAMIFDPPKKREILNHISEVDVDIEGEHIIQALFLIAWISDKLNWQITYATKKSDFIEIEFSRENGEKVITNINSIPLGNPSIYPGQVIGLRLISKVSDDPKRNTCIILGAESAECMRLEAGGMADMQLIEAVVPNHYFSSDSDVSKLLASSRGNTSPLFENTINISSEIFDAIYG